MKDDLFLIRNEEELRAFAEHRGLKFEKMEKPTEYPCFGMGIILEDESSEAVYLYRADLESLLTQL